MTTHQNPTGGPLHPEQMTAARNDLAQWPAGEPVEIRVTGRERTDAYGRDMTPRYTITAWRTQAGTVATEITQAGSPHTHNHTTLQHTAPFPGKAVTGWQVELLAAVATGLYDVEMVR